MPVPDLTDPDYAPYWQAAGAGVLSLPECAGCGVVRWPPRALCRHCRTEPVRWVEREPSGTLHTWTVVTHPTAPGFAEVPYVVGMVEPAGLSGVRLLGNVVGTDPADLRIGMPLRADFHRTGTEPDFTVVRWRPHPPSGTD